MRFNCKQLFNYILVSFLVFSVTGCGSSSSIVHYENDELGISFDYPANWDLEVNERLNNQLLMEAHQGFIVKNSAGISMLVGSNRCSSFNMDEFFSSIIERLLIYYELDHNSVIHPPKEIDNWEYETYKASISIPTLSLPDGSILNQMHEQDVNISQPLDIYVIRNSDDCYVHVNVYFGKSEELNAQALEIVEGIRFIELTLP